MRHKLIALFHLRPPTSAPIGLALFTGSMGYMERGSIDGVQAKFGEMYIPALLANWQLWPLVQLVNFRYMPLK